MSAERSRWPPTVGGRTNEVAARPLIHTTHDPERGVAAGVIEVVQKLMRNSAIAPEDVVFFALSTTQATRAWLEGDVTHVGVAGLALRKAAKLAGRQFFRG